MRKLVDGERASTHGQTVFVRARLLGPFEGAIDFPVGAATQVDWTDFGFALPGCPRRLSAFVMVLCYSRYLYFEFTLSQTMGAFLRRMERALCFLGVVTTVTMPLTRSPDQALVGTPQGCRHRCRRTPLSPEEGMSAGGLLCEDHIRQGAENASVVG